MNRHRLGRRGVLRGLSATAAASFATGVRAAGTIQMISHRYPALEYYAEKMRTAIPGVTVNTQLMPIDKALELATIALLLEVRHTGHCLCQRHQRAKLRAQRLVPAAG